MISISRHCSILNLKPVMVDRTAVGCCNVLPIIFYYLANFYFTYYDINPKTLYHNKHSSVFNHEADYGGPHFTTLETAMY